jgi:EAL domain-containing protein (putative c-di-GMP-specific phosphodiesterase class I)
VLQQACRQAAVWPGAPRVAVNVTARQFRYPGFGASVRRAIDQAGLDPGRLELEIVENAIMDLRARRRCRR